MTEPSKTPRTDALTSWDWIQGEHAMTQLEGHYQRLKDLAGELEVSLSDAISERDAARSALASEHEATNELWYDLSRLLVTASGNPYNGLMRAAAVVVAERDESKAYAVSLRAAAERMVQTYSDWLAGCDNGAKTKDVEAAHINLRDTLAKSRHEIGRDCTCAAQWHGHSTQSGFHLLGCPKDQRRPAAIQQGGNGVPLSNSSEPRGSDADSEAPLEGVSGATNARHAVVPQLGPIWMPSAPLIEKLASLRERVDAVEPADHAGADDLERIVADLRAIEAELRECHSQVHSQAEQWRQCNRCAWAFDATKHDGMLWCPECESHDTRSVSAPKLRGHAQVHVSDGPEA